MVVIDRTSSASDDVKVMLQGEQFIHGHVNNRWNIPHADGTDATNQKDFLTSFVNDCEMLQTGAPFAMPGMDTSITLLGGRG